MEYIFYFHIFTNQKVCSKNCWVIVSILFLLHPLIIFFSALSAKVSQGNFSQIKEN